MKTKIVKIIKQKGLKAVKPVKPVKPVKIQKPVKPVKVIKPVKPVKLAAFPLYEEVKGYIPEIKKPDYEKIKAKNTENFKVRILAGGALRVMSAYYAGRFNKPGIVNTLEVKEIRNSINFSDRMILLALGKIEIRGSDNQSIKAAGVECVPGSSYRKAIKIKIK